MPKDLADRIIMFSVIGLVAWAIIGLPSTQWALSPRSPLAYRPSEQQAAKSAPEGGNWLTKDAAGFFAFGLVVVGIFQLGLFIWQLWLIRESLNDAKTAAEAAKESADATALQAQVARDTLVVMQDTARREMRAYVVVNYARLVHQDNANGYRFEPRLLLLNTGRTPAYDVNYRASADALPFPLPEDFTFPTNDFPINSNSTLGTAQNFTMNAAVPRLFSDEEIEEVKQGVARRIYMWGTATYRDAFATNHYTNFCVSVVFYADRITTVVHYTRRHNDAD
jgi:hypothetical protein